MKTSFNPMALTEYLRCKACNGRGEELGSQCAECAGTGAQPYHSFSLAILNPDGSVATSVDTNEVRIDNSDDLETFIREIRGYISEGFDGLAMQAERDPADYRV